MYRTTLAPRRRLVHGVWSPNSRSRMRECITCVAAADGVETPTNSASASGKPQLSVKSAKLTSKGFYRRQSVGGLTRRIACIVRYAFTGEKSHSDPTTGHLQGVRTLSPGLLAALGPQPQSGCVPAPASRTNARKARVLAVSIRPGADIASTPDIGVALAHATIRCGPKHDQTGRQFEVARAGRSHDICRACPKRSSQ